MRSVLSPAFTSSKLRYVFELIDKCGQQIDLFLLKEYEKQKVSGQKGRSTFITPIKGKLNIYIYKNN